MAVLLFLVAFVTICAIVPTAGAAAYGHFSTRNRKLLTAARNDAAGTQKSLDTAEDALRRIQRISEEPIVSQEADLALDVIQANRYKEISS